MAGTKGSKYYNVFLKHSIWLEGIDNNEIVSYFLFNLLKEVHQLGSIKRAAEKLNISYRKAWGDIKEAEKLLGFELLIKSRGGEKGGQSQLSEEGIELMNAYNELIQDIESSVKKVTRKFFHSINKK